MSEMEQKIADMIADLSAGSPLILAVLSIAGTLTISMTAIVYLTPTKVDDLWLAKWRAKFWVGMPLRILESFSTIKTKEEKKKLEQ
jgi:hypothetical protein